MKKQNLTPLEDAEQKAFVNYLDMQGFKYFAVPNGGFRHKLTAAKLKAEGVKAGVPDIVILEKSATKQHKVLFVEMKRQEGGQVSEKQKEWHDWLDENDYAICVAEGCEQAIRLLHKYLTQY